MASREHLGGHLAPWEAILAPRDQPGGPWEQQDGQEVVNDRFFVDLGVISGPVLCQLLGFKMRRKSFSFLDYFHVIFYGFLIRMFDVWDLEIVVFTWKALQKSIFMEIVLKEFQDYFLMLF